MTSAAFLPLDRGTARLRLLEAADLPTTLAWRNHPDSRVWFLSTEPITRQGHERWFADYLDRSDDLVFIVEEADEPVAQVSLYRIRPAERTAEFGRLLVAPHARGRGISHLATELCVAAAAERLDLATLTLEVKASNVRAIHAYERAGFSPVDAASVDDDVRAMVLDLTRVVRGGDEARAR